MNQEEIKRAERDVPELKIEIVPR